MEIMDQQPHTFSPQRVQSLPQRAVEHTVPGGVTVYGFSYPLWHSNFHHLMVDNVFPVYATIAEDRAGRPFDARQVMLLWLPDFRLENRSEHVHRQLSCYKTLPAQTDSGELVHIPRLVVGSYGWTPMNNAAYYWAECRHVRHPRAPERVAQRLLEYGDLLLESAGVASRIDRSNSLAVSGGYILVLDRRRDRRILNVDQLMATLKSTFATTGVKVYPTPVYMEDLTLVEQIRVAAGARAVIAPHGAHWAHMLFMRPGTVVIDIEMMFCEGRHAPQIRALADIIGLLFRLYTPYRTEDVPGFDNSVMPQLYYAAEYTASPCMNKNWFNFSLNLDLQRVVDDLREALATQHNLAEGLYCDMLRRRRRKQSTSAAARK